MIGREGEMQKLRALLRGAGLVTLHGPPGIGKTALARALCEHEADAVFCDLTNARTYDDVAFVLAGALEVSLGGGKDLGKILGASVAARASALVVLDCGEGATDAAAKLAGELGEVRVLVASRELLRVPGEVAMEVGPLAEADAIALFVRAAERVRQGFDAQANAAPIRELARVLSGVPLALLLAASRLAVMDVATLLARIREKLDWLSAKRRGEPERHASLRGAFESSLATLEPEERAALVACTAFRGPFSLEAAEYVLGPNAADLLQSLVEKSLVRSSDEEDVGVRFGMLAILRRLAEDACGEAPGDVRDRHAEYFARAGSTWDDASWYGGVPELPRLLAMQSDLLAAHAHAAARGSPDALRAAIAVYPMFAALGPYSAFVAMLDEKRDERIAATADPSLASRFHLVRARGLQLGGMRDEAAAALEKSLQYARKSSKPGLAARALAFLALARRTQGSLAEARERFEASAALFRDAGDAKSEAVVLSGLASLDLGEGDLDAAKRALESAIAALIAIEPATAAMMRVDLGIVLQEMGDLEGARGVYEAALVAHRAAGNRRHEGITLGYLGTLEDEQGRADAAEVSLEAALVVLRELGDPKFVAVFGGALAAVRAQRGDALGAKSALEEAERVSVSAEPRLVAAVALHRLRVEAAAGRSSKSIVERRGAALGLLQQSDDVRFAARMLDRVLVLEPTPSQARAEALSVAEDASWLELPGGKRIDLRRRAVHRRLVERLVRERLASPGVAVAAVDLVAAGWPGEKLSGASAQNRLHVALATLRADGLRDLLKRDAGGYALDASVDVRVERG
ncbi:MAG TPA: tetratricopeptide repeat protein [Polyangiaceae bacterium]|jgi:predicted ATPase